MNPSPISSDVSVAAQTWPLAATSGVARVEPLPPALEAAASATSAPGTADTPAASINDATVATTGAAAAPVPSPATTRTAATAFAEGQPVATTTTASTTAAPSFGEPQSGAGMVGTTVVTLLLVIGFILLLAWLAKRVPGLGGASNPALKVVGSLALGPRERVVVVAVGETQLLLATGPGGTRTLHTLEQPLPMPANGPSPFAQVLAQQFGKKPA